MFCLILIIKASLIILREFAMTRTVYFYFATAALFCCFAFCFFLLAFKSEKDQIFGIDITDCKDSSTFKFICKKLIHRLMVITGFYLLPTLFFIRYFSHTNKIYPLIPLLLMLSSYALFFLDSRSKVLSVKDKMFVPETEKSFILSIIFVLPFIPIIFNAFALLSSFDNLPQLIPSHWKLSGTIDSYKAKSILQLLTMILGEGLILALFPATKDAFFIRNAKITASKGLHKIKIIFLNIQMWGFSILFAELNNCVLNSRNINFSLFCFFLGIEITILILTIILNLLSNKKG